jgi:hypothetical protein
MDENFDNYFEEVRLSQKSTGELLRQLGGILNFTA